MAVVVALVVLGGRLAVALVDRPPAPGGPAGSSYATAPEGLAAWAELLAAAGHPVERLRVPLALAEPSQDTVVLAGIAVAEDDLRGATGHLARGGRLVVVGASAALAVAERIGLPIDGDAGGPEDPSVLAAVAETDGVGRIDAGGTARFTDVGPALPIVGDPDGGAVTVAVSPAMRGRVVFVADPSPLTNARLDRADNARLALALAGPAGTPVRFAEAAHGFGSDGGFGALPEPVQRTAAVAALAAVLHGWSRGRRLGPPTVTARPLPPARRLFVDAVATTLIRTGDRAAAAAVLRQRAGLGDGPVDDDAALVEVGRAAAAVERRRPW